MTTRVPLSCARRWRRALAALLVGAAPWPVAAQLPGLPLLQGAFPAPGLAVGANVGRGEGRTLVAGAVGYGPRSERFGLVAGAGMFSASVPGYGGSHIAYGARFALRALQFANERLALTPFVGFGSARSTLESPSTAGFPPRVTGGPVRTDDIPLGVAAGWRFRLGASRAAALSVAPAYTVYRRTGGATDSTEWALRVATVADVALTPRLGATLGLEFGQTGKALAPQPRGSSIGVAVSYAFARR